VDGWILGKFARRLHENLILQGVDADIAKFPDASADINHHIIYLDYDGKKTTTETMMITHIDTDWKVDMVRQQLVNAAMGICMSTDTLAQLVHQGIPRHKLCCVNPAHDGGVRPRRKLIGITSKVQPGGCKREQMLLDLASQISGDDFEFFIMGAGWSAIVDSMRKQGIEVEYHHDFDERIYLPKVSTLDYYLYFGQDEGSMGFLDALRSGIPTIVTPQGFHLDAVQGITHPFNELHELVNIFREIAEHKNRLYQAVESWTWPEYARQHVLIWDYLLHKRISTPISRNQEKELKSMRVAQGRTLSNLNAAFYGGVYKIRRKFFKIRSHVDAMVRYRYGKHVRRNS
jgi:hypothetical protein